MNFFRKAGFFLEYSLFRSLIFIVNLLPLQTALSLAGFLGGLGFHLLKKKREIALTNLRAAFKNEKSEEEINRIARASFQNLAKTAFEFVRIPSIVKHGRKIWKFEKESVAVDAYRQGRGLIVILAHFGNWELMGISGASIAGRSIYAIARPVKNPFVYAYIRNLRKAGGVESIDKSGAVRASIQMLKKSEAVAMLIDQHERQASVAVDFFGRKAFTTTLPAMIALKYNVPVVFSYVIRSGDGTYTHHFEEVFETISTGNDEADIFANTQQYVKKIEEAIRKKPEDWLWMHRRWRS